MLAITFRNISHLAEVSDYEYTVLVGGGDRARVLESGFVRGHHREDGWGVLVYKFAKERQKGGDQRMATKKPVKKGGGKKKSY